MPFAGLVTGKVANHRSSRQELTTDETSWSEASVQAYRGRKSYPSREADEFTLFFRRRPDVVTPAKDG